MDKKTLTIEEYAAKAARGEDFTWGEMMDTITTHVHDKETAAKFLAMVVEHHVRMWGGTIDEAIKKEKSNIGYMAGYYDRETAVKLMELFDCAHPRFGKTFPTPDEAFRMGKELGERSKENIPGPLTVEKLQAMQPGEIFATGLAADVPGGLFMANTGRQLRWVAVRGKGIPDWAIYCHFSSNTAGWIRDHGDKVHLDKHIRECVPCTDEAFAMYRY